MERKETSEIVRDDEEEYELVHRIYRETVLIAGAYRSSITRELNSLSREFSLPTPMKFSQYDTLCELYHEPEGMTPSAIAKSASMKLPNVSTALAELCELGLVERNVDGDDRRKSVVRLTDLGKRFSDEVVKRCAASSSAIFGSRKDATELLTHYAAIEQAFEKC